MIWVWLACSSEDYSYEHGQGGKESKSEKDLTEDSGHVSEEQSTPTFYGDIRTVANRTCLHCHYEGGRSFDMYSHEVLTAMAEYVARDVRDGGKPPPNADGTCRPYVGSEWSVTEDDKVIFEQWAASGAQVGEPEEAEPYFEPESLEDVDKVISMPQGYPYPNAEQHLCSYIPLNNDEPIWLTGAEFATTDIRFHHFSMMFLPPEYWSVPSGAVQTGEQLHFACDYAGEEDWHTLTSWTPGVHPTVFEAGVRIPANGGIIVNNYWLPEPFPPPDHEASWSLSFDLESEREGSSSPQVNLYRIEVEDFIIPAEDESYTVSTNEAWSGPEGKIVGVFPRTHILSTGLELSLKGTQEQCLGRYLLYESMTPHALMFEEPVTIRSGDLLELSCSFNNATGNPKQMHNPPRDVSQGYGGNLAVCFSTLLIEHN